MGRGFSEVNLIATCCWIPVPAASVGFKANPSRKSLARKDAGSIRLFFKRRVDRRPNREAKSGATSALKQ